MATLLPQTMSAIDWIADASLAALDEAAEAALDRRLAVEDSITFDELIEQMADFTHEQREEFMEAFRMYSRGMPAMRDLIVQAFDRVVEMKIREMQQ